jgi:hypothetical protein
VAPFRMATFTFPCIGSQTGSGFGIQKETLAEGVENASYLSEGKMENPSGNNWEECLHKGNPAIWTVSH